MTGSLKFIAVVILVTLTGCITSSTVDTRRQEKLSAYYNLPAEEKGLVDKGQIKIGMPSDAVYIAWGPPSQVLSGETDQGATTTWLYYGTRFEEIRRWNYYEVRRGRRSYHQPVLDFDYVPRSYVSAEVIFANGVVKSWRMLGPH